MVVPVENSMSPEVPSDQESPEATTTEPVDVSEVPELITTAPDEPDEPSETPLNSDIDPVLPFAVVPELKSNKPLEPETRAFAERITTSPEEAAEPKPLITDTAPPVDEESVVSPART